MDPCEAPSQCPLRRPHGFGPRCALARRTAGDREGPQGVLGLVPKVPGASHGPKRLRKEAVSFGLTFQTHQMAESSLKPSALV